MCRAHVRIRDAFKACTCLTEKKDKSRNSRESSKEEGEGRIRGESGENEGRMRDRNERQRGIELKTELKTGFMEFERKKKRQVVEKVREEQPGVIKNVELRDGPNRMKRGYCQFTGEEEEGEE